MLELTRRKIFSSLYLLIGLALWGCGGGGDSVETGSVDPGALAIGGTPVTSISEGLMYSYVPTVLGGTGGNLTFSISNTPSWATFNTSTGALTGAPSMGDVGMTSEEIVISVDDGSQKVSLPGFTITVLSSAIGSATLSWKAPTQNSDGSQLMPGDLAGFNVYYGTTVGQFGNVLSINNPSVDTSVVQNLSSGEWFFWITAFDQFGNESESSNVASKTISI